MTEAAVAKIEDLLTRRVPPQNLDAENAVLGGVLIDGARALDVIGLRPTDFYKEGHRKIFEVMTAMAGAGQAVDVLMTSTALRAANALDDAGGEAYLAQLVDEAGILVNLP